jgi:16S rRNA (uracil1498-N3)-methyltransferase
VVELRGDDARKVRLVLRKRDGDEIEVIDSSGGAFVGALILAAHNVRARLTEAKGPVAPAALEIVLAQAVPKGAKMDFVVEKATELGIARLIPLLTERAAATYARAGKTERWRRLARSAAEQCGRRDIPLIDEPLDWKNFCDTLASFDCTLVLWELAERSALRETLPALLSGVRRIAVAIGPEGGFSHAEIEYATAAGAKTVSLGRRILRTETAGLVACSILRYASGEL